MFGIKEIARRVDKLAIVLANLGDKTEKIAQTLIQTTSKKSILMEEFKEQFSTDINHLRSDLENLKNDLRKNSPFRCGFCENQILYIEINHIWNNEKDAIEPCVEPYNPKLKQYIPICGTCSVKYPTELFKKLKPEYEEQKVEKLEKEGSGFKISCPVGHTLNNTDLILTCQEKTNVELSFFCSNCSCWYYATLAGNWRIKYKT